MFTDSHMTRKSPPAYADGVYMLAGQDRPSPRKLSTMFMKGDDGMSSAKNRTALLAFFGKLHSYYCYAYNAHFALPHMTRS